MIAYRERGEPAEALNVYRRCRHMLSVVLGAKPSAETEAIRATLG
jgi:DNA-binding SARP family transcriptional activator